MMGAVGADHAVPEVLSEPVPNVSDVATAPIAPSVGLMLALQRAAGNVAVSRMLQREPAALVPGKEEYDTARKERDAFVAAGKKGPQTYNPSTRNPDNYYGGFDVEYDPGGEALNDQPQGRCPVPGGDHARRLRQRRRGREPSAETAAAVATINKLPPADRAAAVNAVAMVEPGRSRRRRRDELPQQVPVLRPRRLDRQHPIHATKKYWEDLGATT